MSVLRLEWPANPANELVTAYQVLESQDGGPWGLKGVTNGDTFLQFNAVAGHFAWKVRAINFVGAGPDSPVVNGPDVPSAPGQPTLTVVS